MCIQIYACLDLKEACLNCHGGIYILIKRNLNPTSASQKYNKYDYLGKRTYWF